MAVNTAELLKPEYYLPAPLSSLETHSIHPMWVDPPWTTSQKKNLHSKIFLLLSAPP